MRVNEESKQEYLQARDVFAASYKDFLIKLLSLLYEADNSTSDPEVRKDVAHFTDEVSILKRHIEDFQNEEERAKRAGMSASSETAPRGASYEQQNIVRAPSPGEDSYRRPGGQDSTSSGTAKVNLASAGSAGSIASAASTVGSFAPGQTTSTTQTEKSQQKSPSKSKSTTQSDSSDEIQAEVESAPSQLTSKEVPQVFAPAVSDDGRVVSAFCAFRYHNAEFRQLFMRQGTNNSCCVTAAAVAAAATRDVAMNNYATGGCPPEAELIQEDQPTWLAPLARYTLHLMRRAFRTATPDQWDALNCQLSRFGFKAEVHFALWLRLSATAGRDDVAEQQQQEQEDPASVFNAIPPLTGLPERLSTETKIMLQTLNLLSE